MAHPPHQLAHHPPFLCLPNPPPAAVLQAQSALQGLLPRAGGVAADYAGAIDVLEVLQGVLDEEALLALDCFK